MRSRLTLPVLALACALVVTPGVAAAANNFDIEWHIYNYPGSCADPQLATEGQANFDVNQVPIPTYTVDGSIVYGANGSWNADFHAPFSGALLLYGENEIDFATSVTNGAGCTQNDHTVRLDGPSVDRLLFQFSNTGHEVSGATSVDLTLREIDPDLYDAIENLRRAIAEERDSLLGLGRDADVDLARIEALEAAVDDLLDRGWDEITPEELDALLSEYDDLPDEVRDALVEFLSDLQQNIEELREEIARIVDVFEQRAAAIDGVVDAAPGFDPEDPSQFEEIADGEVPPIDIPDILGDEPWTDAHDPYAAYADEVLAQLAASVFGNEVVDRPDFLAVWNAWRYNVAAIERVLARRGTVSVQEWGAFLNAKGRVLQYVENFIDDNGWMLDAPIPPAVRALVELLKDLDVAYRFKQRAEALQLELNQWSGPLTDRQRAALDILLVVDALARERLAQPAPQEEEDGFWDTLGDVVDGVISFTPVGDFLDACAVVTGRAGCWQGAELTLEERALYGLGVAIGSGAAWKAAAAKVSGGAVGAVRKVGEVLDDVPIRRPVSNMANVQHLPGGDTLYTHVQGWTVRYDRRGFPDFSPYRHPDPSKNFVKVTLSKHPNASTARSADIAAANAKAGFASTPVGYTWHHHDEVGMMELVDAEVHGSFPHTGGFALHRRAVNLEPE